MSITSSIPTGKKCPKRLSSGGTYQIREEKDVQGPSLKPYTCDMCGEGFDKPEEHFVPASS